MNYSLMAKGIIIALREMGMQGIRLDEDDDGIIMYYSVPKSSDHRDANGNEMAGKHLALTIRRKLEELGWEFSICRYQIRDEHWDDAKRIAAGNAAKKELGLRI